MPNGSLDSHLYGGKKDALSVGKIIAMTEEHNY